jgi:hypothetical protein
MSTPAEKLEEPQVEEVATDEEPQVSDEDLLSAIDEELKEVIHDEPEAKTEEESEPANAAADEPSDDEPAVEGKPDSDEPEQASKTDDDQPADKQQQAADDVPDAVPDVETKPSDEFGELDKDAPEKTRERFDTLKSRYDEIVAERDTVKQENEAVRAEVDTWQAAVQDATQDPQQFGAMLNVLKLMNSKDPAKLEQAYQALSADRDAIGKVLGKPANGASPVDQYPDLKGKVDEGMLDEESAAEIARLRAAEKLNVASQQHQQEQTSQQQAVNQAMADVKALGAELAQTDPNFQAKVPYLTPIIESVVASGATPDKWVPAIRSAIAKLPAAAAAPPAPKPAAPNSIRPQFNSTHGSQPGLCTDAEGAGFCSRSYQYVA